MDQVRLVTGEDEPITCARRQRLARAAQVLSRLGDGCASGLSLKVGERSAEDADVGVESALVVAKKRGCLVQRWHGEDGAVVGGGPQTLQSPHRLHPFGKPQPCAS